MCLLYLPNVLLWFARCLLVVCYVLLGFATFSYVLLCFSTFCYGLLCLGMFRYVLLCFAMFVAVAT